MGIWHNWAVYRRAQVIYGAAIVERKGVNDGVTAVNLTPGDLLVPRLPNAQRVCHLVMDALVQRSSPLLSHPRFPVTAMLDVTPRCFFIDSCEIPDPYTRSIALLFVVAL